MKKKMKNRSIIEWQLLIRYSFLGSVLANLEFKESNEIKTAETDGKVVLYNQNFVNGLTTEKEKIFVFAHEVFHRVSSLFRCDVFCIYIAVLLALCSVNVNVVPHCAVRCCCATTYADFCVLLNARI